MPATLAAFAPAGMTIEQNRAAFEGQYHCPGRGENGLIINREAPLHAAPRRTWPDPLSDERLLLP
jgi:hypothetical protein